MNNINRRMRGFTLIELLVVISIIGLLAAIALVSLGSARAKGRDAKRIRDIREIRTALELYFGDCGGYPAASGTTLPSSITGNSTYLAVIPTNPSPPGGSYGYNTTGATSSTSTACASATVYSTYNLIFTLENNTATILAGAHTATPTGIR